MQVSVELPQDVVTFLGERQLQSDLRLSYALWLYQTGRATIGKACRLAGMDIYEFMTACREYKVPVMEFDRDEIVERDGGMMTS